VAALAPAETGINHWLVVRNGGVKLRRRSAILSLIHRPLLGFVPQCNVPGLLLKS
jgi:hypothetical protein